MEAIELITKLCYNRSFRLTRLYYKAGSMMLRHTRELALTRELTCTPASREHTTPCYTVVPSSGQFHSPQPAPYCCCTLWPFTFSEVSDTNAMMFHLISLVNSKPGICPVRRSLNEHKCSVLLIRIQTYRHGGPDKRVVAHFNLQFQACSTEMEDIKYIS